MPDHSSSLHADVLTQLLNGSVVLQVVGNFQSNQGTNNAAHVVVSNVYSVCVETSETTDLDVLTDGQNLLLQSGLNGQLAHLASLQRVNVSRVLLDDNGSNVVYECLEVSVLCNEVGLSVDLNDCSDAALVANLSAYNALSSNTVSLLSSLCQALLAQQLDCLVEVAVSLG